MTGVDGAPLEPPPRDKKRLRKPKAAGKLGDEKQTNGSGKSEKPEKQNGKGKNEKKAGPARDPPFHSVIPDDLKAKISDKGVKLVRNTVDVALDGSRIKLGQGGYASIVDAKGIVGEGSYTCDESAKVSFTWEKSLEFEGGEWNLGDVTKLMGSLSLAEGKIFSRFVVMRRNISANLFSNPKKIQSRVLGLTKLQRNFGEVTSLTPKICSWSMVLK